jgi:hypothetical protein
MKPEPLEIDLLISADQRRDPQHVATILPEVIADLERRVTVNEHQAFRQAISRPTDRFDEIDELLDEHIVIDPFNGDPPSRRKDKETNRLLAILDGLERGAH